MATWIFLFHLIFPLSGPTDPAVTAADEAELAVTAADTDEEVRYRGLEQMFARFEAEPG